MVCATRDTNFIFSVHISDASSGKCFTDLKSDFSLPSLMLSPSRNYFSCQHEEVTDNPFHITTLHIFVIQILNGSLSFFHVNDLLPFKF